MNGSSVHAVARHPRYLKAGALCGHGVPRSNQLRFHRRCRRGRVSAITARHWPAVLGGRDDADAARLLGKYFSRRHDGSPRFTGSYFEQIGADRNAGTDTNVLTSEDFVAVSCLSVEVPAEAAIRLLYRQREEVTARLEAIPPGLELVSAADSDLDSNSALHHLWWLLRSGGDGLGPTATSKLLARKRPHWCRSGTARSSTRRSRPPRATGFWLRERLSEIGSDGRMLWQWLADVVEQVPDAAHITPLRVLDVCIWLTDWESRNPT